MSQSPAQPRAPRTLSTMAVTMMLAAAATRLLPHPANFTPLLAIALFGTARLADRRAAFLVPLGAMLLSDLALELIAGQGIHALQPVVYASVALCGVIGLWLRTRTGILSTIVASLAASVTFFVMTNFAVWAAGGLYPQSAAGLGACYLAALPFFRSTLTSTMLYAVCLVAGYDAIRSILLRSPHGI